MKKINWQNLPPKPGIYKFYGLKDRLLYIGEAKNLKHRVASYFQRTKDLDPRRQQMVAQIKKVDYTVVSNETEALLLEASLIKKHQPPYNVLLKDDKYFQFFKITTSEAYSKVLLVRRVYRDHNRYFGPYPKGANVKALYRLLRSMFPLRTCNRQLRPDKLPLGKVCLQYHLGNCFGPCENLVSPTAYRRMINQVVDFLTGHYQTTARQLQNQMQHAAKKQDYELAAKLRNQLFALRDLTAKQKVVSTKLEDEDLISYYRLDDYGAINLFQVRQGRLLEQQNFLLTNVRDVALPEIYQSFFSQYYGRLNNFPPRVVLPAELQQSIINAKGKVVLPRLQGLVFPQRGKKAQLLKLGAYNAKEYLERTITREQAKKLATQETLRQLQRVLSLPTYPQRIEAYDVSHLQGTLSVGSMVVFTNGQPDKQAYRRFKIKTVKGTNDPAMLAEVVRRRSGHPEWPRPDLIILDGGLGQWRAVMAVETIHELSLRPRIAALAKREEILYAPKPLKLPKDSPTLHLLQHLRDEAHRFAVGYHRQLRVKEIKKS